MRVWEKIDGKWKITTGIDFTDLLAKADPSDDKIYVTMTDTKEFGIKKSESKVETMDDLLATARDVASERAKAKGHNYIVRIFSTQFGDDTRTTMGVGSGAFSVPRKVRQFKIEDWDEVV